MLYVGCVVYLSVRLIYTVAFATTYINYRLTQWNLLQSFEQFGTSPFKGTFNKNGFPRMSWVMASEVNVSHLVFSTLTEQEHGAAVDIFSIPLIRGKL